MATKKKKVICHVRHSKNNRLRNYSNAIHELCRPGTGTPIAWYLGEPG